MIIHVYEEIKLALHHWNQANGSGPYGQFIGDGGIRVDKQHYWLTILIPYQNSLLQSYLSQNLVVHLFISSMAVLNLIIYNYCFLISQFIFILQK